MIRMMSVLVILIGTGAAVNGDPLAPLGSGQEVDMTLGEAVNHKVVDALVGDLFEIRLEGKKARTGWEASPVEGDAVQRIGAAAGEVGVPATPVVSSREGADDKAIGTYAFRYRAMKPGEAKLRFVYVSPGGPGVTQRRATALENLVEFTVRVAADRPSDGRLEVSVIGKSERYGAGEPVVVAFDVKNVSAEPQFLWSRACSWGHEVYYFVITDANGHTTWLREPEQSWRRNVPSAKRLAPGETFSVDIDLNKWLPKPLPAGSYTVRGMYRVANEFKGRPGNSDVGRIWVGKLAAKPIGISVAPGK